jgi:hypothetical protein
MRVAALLILTLILTLILLACSGCHGKKPAQVIREQTDALKTDIATAKSSNVEADRATQAAAVKVRVVATQPSTPPESRATLDAAGTDLKAAHDSHAAVAKALDATVKPLEIIPAAADKQQAQYDKLEGKWYVKWGVRAQWVFGIGVTLSVLFGIGYLIFTDGNAAALLALLRHTIWPVIKGVVLFLVHLVTLGVSWVLLRIHAHKATPPSPPK